MEDLKFQREGEFHAGLYEQLARDKRSAAVNLITESAKHRIDLIRDYTVAATAVLGVDIAILTAANSVISQRAILWGSVLIMLAVIIYSFIARHYKINEVDDALLYIEKDYANTTNKALKIKLSKSKVDRKAAYDYEEGIGKLTLNTPRIFRYDIEVVGYALSFGIILLVVSLVI